MNFPFQLPEFVAARLVPIIEEKGITNDTTEDVVYSAIAEVYNAPCLLPGSVKLDLSLIDQFESYSLLEHRFIPAFKDNKYCYVLTSNPWNVVISDIVTKVLPHHKLVLFTSPQSRIESTIRTIESSAGTFATSEGDSVGAQVLSLDTNEQGPFGEISRLIAKCLADGANDLHLQMEPEQVLARREIGQIVSLLKAYNKKQGSDIVNVFLAKTQIRQEDRIRPCDGNLAIQHAGKRVDLRIATMPSYDPTGQSSYHTAIRFQDSSKIEKVAQLEDIFSDIDIRSSIISAITTPGSLNLFTGPTGSGKTTTLRACLIYLNTSDRIIYTIEDPPENVIKGITSIQVRDGIVSYARAVKGLLRMKPHVVMVGEIRDKDTALAVMELAATGHIVLSTLHCKRSADIPERLEQFGIDPCDMVSNLRLCSSQRILPLICPHCSIEEKLSSFDIKISGVPESIVPNLRRRNPSGCPHCSGGITGIKTIIEIVEFSKDLQSVIYKHDAGWSEFKSLANSKLGCNSLHNQAINLLNDGKTDLAGVRKCLSLANV